MSDKVENARLPRDEMRLRSKVKLRIIAKVKMQVRTELEMKIRTDGSFDGAVAPFDIFP